MRGAIVHPLLTSRPISFLVTALRRRIASEERQERRLPCAVGADEADAFAVIENSTETREYFARPIVTFEIGKPQ
jgi:hypothetical protein